MYYCVFGGYFKVTAHTTNYAHRLSHIFLASLLILYIAYHFSYNFFDMATSFYYAAQCVYVCTYKLNTGIKIILLKISTACGVLVLKIPFNFE